MSNVGTQVWRTVLLDNVIRVDDIAAAFAHLVRASSDAHCGVSLENIPARWERHDVT